MYFATKSYNSLNTPPPSTPPPNTDKDKIIKKWDEHEAIIQEYS
jgi:hypothetical protein